MKRIEYSFTTKPDRTANFYKEQVQYTWYNYAIFKAYDFWHRYILTHKNNMEKQTADDVRCFRLYSKNRIVLWKKEITRDEFNEVRRKIGF